MGTLKTRLRDGLTRLSPNVVGGLLAARSRRLCQRLERRHGLAKMSEGLIAEYGTEVLAGPFRGMSLPEGMHHRHVGPFLAGTYEAALHPFLAQVRSHEYHVVVDVGSSFGYYAVGLARTFPAARVIAYDTDPWARETTRQTAALNRCPNVEVRAACSPAELDTALEGRCLVVSDCEGYEHALFRALPPERFRRTDLVIEVHPPGDPDAERRLRRYFAHTHDAQVLSHMTAVETNGLPAAAVVEWRDPEQRWLVLTAQDEDSA